MNVPPKGTIIRARYELGVRWRQMGRALAKESPLLGTAGSVIAGWPLIRDLYPSEKAVKRSDDLVGRRHPTLAYRIVDWLMYAYFGVALVLLVLIVLGVVRL